MMYVSVVGLFLSDMSRTDSKTSPCATIFVSLDGSLLRDIHLFCRCHLSDIGVDSTSLQKYRHGGEICLSLCVSLRDIALIVGLFWQVIVMAEGRIAEKGRPLDLLRDPTGTNLR